MRTTHIFHITYTSKYTGARLTSRIEAYDRGHAVRLAYSMLGATRHAPVSAVQMPATVRGQ